MSRTPNPPRSWKRRKNIAHTPKKVRLFKNMNAACIRNAARNESEARRLVRSRRLKKRRVAMSSAVDLERFERAPESEVRADRGDNPPTRKDQRCFREKSR